MTKPISPDEIDDARVKTLPPEVFQVFNDLIVNKWNGFSATVLQKDAALAISQAMCITSDEVFERGLLNVEHAYREQGWDVVYDKPGFNESYSATFVFKKARP